MQRRDRFCPECKCAATLKTYDSRMVSENHRWRRLKCVICNSRFTTYEVFQDEWNEFMEWKNRDDK